MLINIYIYKNLITNKYVYVGQTSSSLSKRAGKNGIMYEGSLYFWNEIQKYGWGNFQGEILTTVEDRKYADLLEWFYTIEFNTIYPYGCNYRIGRIPSSGLIEQQRRSLKKTYEKEGFTPHMRGKHHTEETRKKISETLKQKNYVNPMKGKHLSEETKKRIKEKLLGKSNKAAIGNKNVSGKHWYTNGIKNTMQFTCPEGFYPGKA